MPRRTHIFLYNSNIFGGAQRVAVEREKVPTWQCVRVDYSNLFRLLRYGKAHDGVSLLAGSVPPGNEALWEAARVAGFDTTLLRRVTADNGKLVEQGVDEAIHLRIGNILLDTEPDNVGTIVLATGDGAQTDQGSSFTDQVVRAAKRGWNVEIWSWQSQLAKRLRDTRLAYPNLVRVMKLDEWYRSIVFIKGGDYNLNGEIVRVETRTCAGMSLTEGTFEQATR